LHQRHLSQLLEYTLMEQLEEVVIQKKFLKILKIKEN